jgi:hypothetical protein
MTKLTLITERVRSGRPGYLMFRVHDNQIDAVRGFLAHCEKRTTNYELTIAPPKRRRTTGKRSQNARINGHIVLIAFETGNDFSDVKMYIKRRAVRRGYPVITNAEGEIVPSMIDGEPIPISESDASIEDAKLLIDEINQLAAELGIVLPEEDHAVHSHPVT